MSRRPPPPHRYLYVIGPSQGLQKVGIATDPKQRLATLQTAVPFDLHLHLAIPVPFHEAHAIERRAHRLLARSCVRNEWFETTPAEAIAAVKTATAPAPRVTSSTTTQPAPAEWRIDRAERKPITPPSVNPLIAYGRQFRPDAAFHKPPAPLPLFDYAQRASAERDEQVLVEKVVGVLLKRMGG